MFMSAFSHTISSYFRTHDIKTTVVAFAPARLAIIPYHLNIFAKLGFPPNNKNFANPAHPSGRNLRKSLAKTFSIYMYVSDRL
jgi:hypothetical protein